MSSGAVAWSDPDRASMSYALALAARGMNTVDPNPRVGCVLVKDGRTVGEGWHERAGEAHAEVRALAQAGGLARGATAYVTLEPCNHQGRTPPCTLALIEAGVQRVVYAMDDPDPRVMGSGAARLRDSGLQVACGLMERAAEQLNCGYAKRMRTGLPWVRVKLAMSLDGRTALANGHSRWITGDAARKDAQHFRARSSAVLTGVQTILNDDPALNVRVDGASRQPWRIVLDSALRTPPGARVINREGRVLILAVRDDAVARAALQDAGATVEILPAQDGRPELGAVLQRAGHLGMNEIWVEAGSTLAGNLLQGGHVDELVVYIAPALLGNDAQPLARLPPIYELAQRHQLRFVDFRAIGADLRLTARPLPPSGSTG